MAVDKFVTKDYLLDQFEGYDREIASNKYVSSDALDNKVDKVSGKELSKNDYSDSDKAIVNGVTGALANKQDLLIPGTGISIENNVISATSGSVVANPSGAATDNLTKIQIDSTIYSIPSGGSLTLDQMPQDESQNPVKSDGLFDCFSGVYQTIKNAVGGSGRQLLRNDNKTRTVNDVVITKLDENPKVSLNGTASSGIAYGLMKTTGAELKKYGEKLWLSGGISNNVFLALVSEDWSYSTEDRGNGREIDPSILDDNTSYIFALEVAYGTELSDVVVSPMLTLSSVVDKSFEAYHTTAVDWASYAKTGAKNRLGMTLAYLKSINTQGTWSNNAYTHNDVTYTVTETDGYVSNININGTAGSSYSKMNIIGSSYVANKYKGMRLTGAPNGSGSTYYITTFYSNDGSSTVGSESKSYGVDGVVLGDKNYIQSLIYIGGGVNVSSVNLQIMICDANDTDRTFAPHAMTNRELTEAIQSGAVVANPSEEATDSLSKLQVGNDVYSIPVFPDTVDSTPRHIGYFMYYKWFLMQIGVKATLSASSSDINTTKYVNAPTDSWTSEDIVWIESSFVVSHANGRVVCCYPISKYIEIEYIQDRIALKPIVEFSNLDFYFVVRYVQRANDSAPL